MACQKDEQSILLTRKWQLVLDTQDFLALMPEEKRALFDSLPERKQKEALAQIRKQAQQNIFEFKEDQTFIFTLKGKEIRQTGKWRLKDQNRLVLIKENEKGYEELIIDKLKSDTLILISRPKPDILLQTLLVPVQPLASPND
ncbi:MAG: hypothetical protein OHK0053_02650 [Microscillaceae bacterium]